jgi:ATP-dependent Clp protease protease subunit
MFDYDTDSGEIWIYDVIGPAWAGMIDAESLQIALREMGGRDITLRVSSPGGSVVDAVDMVNMLKRYPGNVIAEVDGLAASAASFLILGASEVRAAKNSTFMVHSAMTATFGNKADHQKSIEMLEVADANILGMYSDKSGRTVEELRQDLEAETWMTASQALEWGLIDSIIDEDRDGPQQVPDGMYNSTPASLRVAAVAGANMHYRRKLAKCKAAAAKLI